jgi:hypothetical protein
VINLKNIRIILRFFLNKNYFIKTTALCGEISPREESDAA